MAVNELISIVDRCCNPVELRVAVNWLIRAYSHYHTGEFSCRDEPRFHLTSPLALCGRRVVTSALLHELNVVVVVGFVRKFVVDSAPCWSPVWFRLSLWRVRGTASVL